MAQTRGQLESYLLGREVPEELSKNILDRFEEIGLINDAEYARMWVKSRRAVRGSGPLALARELSLKGVDPVIAQDAIDQRDGDDLDVAVHLAEKKLRSVMRYEPHTRAQRIATYLVRRGYSLSIAFAAAHTVTRRTPEVHGDWADSLASYEDE